jgi:zinc transporter ZupT
MTALPGKGGGTFRGEALPESQRGGHTDMATMGVMGGFALMMILDIAFT